jgi:hypothetical protein
MPLITSPPPAHIRETVRRILDQNGFPPTLLEHTANQRRLYGEYNYLWPPLSSYEAMMKEEEEEGGGPERRVSTPPAPSEESEGDVAMEEGRLTSERR